MSKTVAAAAEAAVEAAVLAVGSEKFKQVTAASTGREGHDVDDSNSDTVDVVIGDVDSREDEEAAMKEDVAEIER